MPNIVMIESLFSSTAGGRTVHMQRLSFQCPGVATRRSVVQHDFIDTLKTVIGRDYNLLEIREPSESLNQADMSQILRIYIN